MEFIDKKPNIEDLKREYKLNGFVTVEGFINPDAIAQIYEDVISKKHLLHNGKGIHNIYQLPYDPNYEKDHPRNKEFCFDTYCLTGDNITSESPLRKIYETDYLRKLVECVTEESPLYNFNDPVGDITLNVVEKGMSMGWHIDVNTHAIIIVIKQAEEGGEYEVFEHSRYDSDGNENYDKFRGIIEGKLGRGKMHRCPPGTLVIHRGCDSIHRVNEVLSDDLRVTAILSYSLDPNGKLSDDNRRKFYNKEIIDGKVSLWKK